MFYQRIENINYYIIMEECMMKRVFTLIFIVVTFSVVTAEDSPLWMRYPAISPDGNTIVFSYKGDLYTVSVEGGEAMLLTIHEAHDFYPVWSPDGTTIAFASNRFGNFDIYIISATGGTASRLTTHSANEYPSGFTPDGKSVLFRAHIQDHPQNVQFPSGLLTELYRVSVKGGRTHRILSTPVEAVCMDKSGKKIIYHDIKGYEDRWRKHHTSAVTRDVWIYDKSKGRHTQLTTYKGEDRNPVFDPEEKNILYLSEQFGSFNVCSFPLNDPASIKQITFHTKHPVRFLTISDKGTICYSYNGEIYTKQKNADPRKLTIIIHADQKSNPVEHITEKSGATEMKISPDGEEIAFIVRGEIFVTSVDYSTTKRITYTPEQERSVSFSPDGKTLLYASERNGSWNIYTTKKIRDEEEHFSRATLLKELPVLETDKETYQPFFSPNGKEIAFLEERTTLKIYNLKTKKSREVLPGNYNYSYSDGDQWFQWSPDSKWLLAGMSPGSFVSNDIALISADGKQDILNLTRSGYSDNSAKWMMDGKMMIWFSDRMGLRSHGSWGSQDDVFAMFFTQESFDNFNLSKEDYEIQKEKEKDQNKNKDKDDSDQKVEPLTFEFSGMEDRIKRLTINSSNLSDAVLTPEGEKLYYLSKFEAGYDLWVREFREDKTKLVMKLQGRSGSLQMDEKGENLFLLSNGSIYKIDINKDNKKPVSFTAEFDLNKPGEKEYLFEHMWRQVLKKFYAKDLHGVNWQFYKNEYKRFLPHINNNFDFSEMMSEMLGELNGSHTGCRYRPNSENKDETASLGLFYDYEYEGNGLKIVEVIEKGPMDKAGSKAKPGTIIEKINGTFITPEMDYFPLLNHGGNKRVLLSLFDPENNEHWEEIVKPISIRRESNLLYERWVKTRREDTEKLSGGEIGYVHVRGMNDASFRKVYSDILGRNHTKKALVVDTRFNGGGWLHDDLVTLLSGQTYMEFYPRGQYFGSEPTSKWKKLSIVLVSESNYSDAHGFPYAYKTLGIGKLVGMPVPGTMTAVWWERLQDPSLVFGIPQVGTKDVKGEYLENQQLEPDVRVDNQYEVVITGHDQQLEKAVQILMQSLK